jgi:hypothetical protein
MRTAMAKCVGFLTRSEALLADALTTFARRHSEDAELRSGARVLAGWSRAHLEALRPVANAQGEGLEAEAEAEAEVSSGAPAPGPPGGAGGLAHDLQHIALLAENVLACWMALSRSAAAVGETELKRTCDVLGAETGRQLAWLHARLHAVSPRAALPEDAAELDSSGPIILSREPTPEHTWGALAGGAISLCVGVLAWLVLGGLHTARDVANLVAGLILMLLTALVFRRVRLGSFAAAVSWGARRRLAPAARAHAGRGVPAAS